MPRRLSIAFALGLLLLAGCAVESTTLLEKGRPYHVSFEGWSEKETLSLAAALEDWRRESREKISLVPVEPGAVFDMTVRNERGPNGNPIYFNRFARLILLDGPVLETYDQGLRAGLCNAIGLFLRMPTHPGPGVMSEDDVRLPFTDSDRASCAAAGYCG